MPVTVETLSEVTVNTKYQAHIADYTQQELKKKYIILHYTAGSTADGAFTHLASQDDGVMVPYIIDRDGTIYQTFDPKYWAYSLGVKVKPYNNGYFDKQAIPIEVVSEGCMVKKGSQYYWWPNNYGSLYRASAPVHEGDFRGFQYHAGFTDKQNASIVQLVNYLCIKFDIPKTLLPHEKQDIYDLAYMDKFTGICSHVNFRPETDKWDIPSFYPFWDMLRG